jgi:hypothetical protein
VTLRRHWLFALLFTLGALLRVMAQVAYQPAILYFDSPRYLHNIHWLNPDGPDPLGYLLTERVLLGTFHDLAALAAFNHLLGLGIAGLIYAVLLRRGVKPWMAALATGPVLLDGFQLLIEQMVMSEPLFQFFVVLGIVLLLWRPPEPADGGGRRGVVRRGSAHAIRRPVAGAGRAAVLCAGRGTPVRPASGDGRGPAGGLRAADDRLRRL